jgi:hypothetical protein
MTFPNSYSECNTGKWTFNCAQGNPVFDFSASKSGLYKQFGFDEDSVNAFANNTLVSTNVIMMQASKNLFLQSSLVTSGGVLQKFNSGSTVDFGIIVYTCYNASAFAKTLSSSTNNTYSFSITDSDDIPINMNGRNIIISLMFFWEPPVVEKFESFMKLIAMAMTPPENNT